MNHFLEILWLPSLTFLLGILVGFFLGLNFYKSKRNGKKLIQNLVSISIFFLWFLSVLIDILNGASNTPLILHLFMGSVLGAINHEFGEWLLKLINRK